MTNFAAPLYFRGQPIFGSAGIVVAQPPELQVQRTYYWGIKGMSEVVGSPSGRELTCSMWLHNRYATRLAVEQAIKIINSWVGGHGPLREVDYSAGTWLLHDHVTFHGFTREPIGGRPGAGPIYDFAGTVDGGWLQAGTLRFFQLTPQ